MGITRVALEPFTIERGWERVSARAPNRRAGRPSASRGVARLVAVDAGGRHRRGGRRARRPSRSRRSPRPRRCSGRIVLLPDGDPPGDSDDRGAVDARRSAPRLACRGRGRDPVGRQRSRQSAQRARLRIRHRASACCPPRRSAATMRRRFAADLAHGRRSDVARADQPDHAGRRDGQQRDRRHPGPRSSRRMGHRRRAPRLLGLRDRRAGQRHRRGDGARGGARDRGAATSRRAGRSGSRCGAGRSRGSSARRRTPRAHASELDRVVAIAEHRCRHRPGHRLDRARPGRPDPGRPAADAGLPDASSARRRSTRASGTPFSRTARRSSWRAFRRST